MVKPIAEDLTQDLKVGGVCRVVLAPIGSVVKNCPGPNDETLFAKISYPEYLELGGCEIDAPHKSYLTFEGEYGDKESPFVEWMNIDCVIVSLPEKQFIHLQSQGREPEILEVLEGFKYDSGASCLYSFDTCRDTNHYKKLERVEMEPIKTTRDKLRVGDVWVRNPGVAKSLEKTVTKITEHYIYFTSGNGEESFMRAVEGAALYVLSRTEVKQGPFELMEKYEVKNLPKHSKFKSYAGGSYVYEIVSHEEYLKAGGKKDFDEELVDLICSDGEGLQTFADRVVILIELPEPSTCTGMVNDMITKEDIKAAAAKTKTQGKITCSDCGTAFDVERDRPGTTTCQPCSRKWWEKFNNPNKEKPIPVANEVLETDEERWNKQLSSSDKVMEQGYGTRLLNVSELTVLQALAAADLIPNDTIPYGENLCEVYIKIISKEFDQAGDADNLNL